MRLIALPLLGAVLFTTACHTTRYDEGTHPPVTVPLESTNVRWNNAALLDDSLAGAIGVQQTGMRETDTGRSEAWAQIRNRTDYRYQVDCRVQFYDGDKVPLGKPTAWERINLSPNEITTYREYSTSKDVGYYYIEIREGR